MKTVAVLEGEYIDDDYIKVFDRRGFNVYPIEQLYFEPQRIAKLKEIDPEFIYIRTTGLDLGGRKQARKRIIQEFSKLDWVPKNVVFFNEESAMTYLDVARQLKKKGTKFYLLPFSDDQSWEDREITWI